MLTTIRWFRLNALLVLGGVLAACGGGGGNPGSAPSDSRSLADRPDREPGLYQVHVIYAVPSDRPDRRLDVDGTLSGSLASAQAFFADAGEGIALRLDETLAGAVDISFLALPRPDADYAEFGLFAREAIQSEVLNAGFKDARKLYLVYYDGTNPAACGGAPPLTTGDPVTVLYLNGLSGTAEACEQNPLRRADETAGYWEWAAIHEVVHALGFADPCGPNHAEERPGHTGDLNFDLMYAGTEPWLPTVVDPGQDDYFGANVAAGCARNLLLSAFITPQSGDQVPVNFRSRVPQFMAQSSAMPDARRAHVLHQGCILPPPQTE